jgi:hypothetical protein
MFSYRIVFPQYSGKKTREKTTTWSTARLALGRRRPALGRWFKPEIFRECVSWRKLIFVEEGVNGI